METEKFIKSYFAVDESKKKDLNVLTFSEKVKIGIYINIAIQNDNSLSGLYFLPVYNYNNYFSYLEETVRQLNEKKLIVVSPNTDKIFFGDIDFKNKTIDYNPFIVDWILNVRDKNLNTAGIVKKFLDFDFEIEDKTHLVSIWKDISVLEIADYLELSIKNVLSVDYKCSDQTFQKITDFLDHYSISQIFYVINNSINKALRSIAEHSINPKHAANTVIFRCDSLVNKSLLNNWNLMKFDRHYDLPQNKTCEYIFNKVLKIGNKGFYNKPDISELER